MSISLTISQYCQYRYVTFYNFVDKQNKIVTNFTKNFCGVEVVVRVSRIIDFWLFQS